MAQAEIKRLQRRGQLSSAPPQLFFSFFAVECAEDGTAAATIMKTMSKRNLNTGCVTSASTVHLISSTTNPEKEKKADGVFLFLSY